MPAYVDATGVTNLTNDIKTLADATYPANASIAPAYDSTSAYAVDDYCLKNGLLYKCNTAIATGGEAWNSAHWTQVSVSSELQNISSDSKPKIGTITLTAANWTGSGPYTQTVSIAGGTANSKVDIQFSPAQLTQLVSDGVFGLIIENNNAVFTAYALGAAPTTTMTVQITRTETI